jgi:hypothetical protein
MKTLAQALGLEPETKTTESSAQQPKSDPSKLSAKAIAKAIIRSPEYLESIRRRILADSLPPAVEVLLHHIADGKPVDRVEVKNTSASLADLSTIELEAKLKELSDIARRLREPITDNAAQVPEIKIH